MGKSNESKRQATRTRLVDAAVQVVLNESPASLTTRRILEVAGLSKGALYHHFASKDELYGAIAERFLDLDDALTRELPALEAHARSIESTFDSTAGTLLGRLRGAAADNEAVREVMCRYDARVVAEYGELNRQSMKSGLFRNDIDADALVEVIGVFIEGLDLRANTGFVTDRSRVTRTFLEAIAQSILDDTHPDAEELRRRIVRSGQ